MKTIEEYQEQTEERWRRLAAKGEYLACGWCEFDKDMDVSQDCLRCPVVRVFGRWCGNIPQMRAYYDAWSHSGEREAAQAVYELAVEYREELIAAAKAIVEEVQGE